MKGKQIKDELSLAMIQLLTKLLDEDSVEASTYILRNVERRPVLCSFNYLSGFLRSLLLATFGLSQITNYSFNNNNILHIQ